MRQETPALLSAKLMRLALRASFSLELILSNLLSLSN
jgi:hypothetical protein